MTNKRVEVEIKPCVRINTLRYWRSVQDLTKKHHTVGETVLRKIFYKYIYPVYPMCYRQFLNILGESGLNARIKEQEEIELEKMKKRNRRN